MDNIFLIHDILDLCKSYDVHVGIVSLDKEKAFNRVDHSHLFAALRVFGFGEGLLYSGAQCMVRMGAGLSRPIPVQ